MYTFKNKFVNLLVQFTKTLKLLTAVMDRVNLVFLRLSHWFCLYLL